MLPISEAEFQEIMERNKTVSSSAIARAVQDASAGEFGTAIETLVTAVSLIKQSKIANDDRCKILISSLQDTLKGIEDKSYGQRIRHRSRSGSPRESSRKKHRHRSRSPRDRNEYRRSEDYDGKYSRDHRRR
jgi:cleavage and polyadenylation specificity factor subunit 6/7